MIFLSLINNVTLIIALSILYSFVIRRWKYKSLIRQAISGLLFGVVAVVGMMNPLIISPGLIFDGRSIIISVAGFIGGWVTALIAALMSIIYRTWLGGPGAIMGVSVIASSAAIGIAYHYIRLRRPHIATPLYLIGFGIIVHICMLALTMTLPSGMRYQVFSNIAIPVILIYPLGTVLVLVVLLDLESRLHAEYSLQKSEEKYRLVVENANEAILIAQDGFLKYVNPMTLKILGYSEDLLTSRPFVEIIHLEDRERLFEAHSRRMRGEETQPVQQFRVIARDGTFRLADSHAIMISWEGKPATLNYITDITERKRAEETLKKSEENYRRLFDSSPVAIYQVDFKTGKFLKANDVICEYFGCSHEEIISHSPYDLLTDESKQLFLERLSKMSLGEKVTETPEYEIIDKNGRRRWLQLSSKNIYDSEDLMGADVVAHDITERKRAEERLKETLESLRKSFGTTIQVMISAVETRDPYTAGHQKRSADLARAIATEMELSQDRIEGIRMAGPIHDIGKLSIPAEILSKPGKLSDIEFSLIKGHAQSGYEILKDIESPWPLAQIVYQHHERMNGSGYPRNLKGDEILMEARILAVADVVESMASHRPYRSSLGINAALEEIEKNKETLYDADVADACLRLFREKGFQIGK